ncbi:MAG: response regulator [Lysobacteraceae bacterium]
MDIKEEPQASILVVDDDSELRALLQRYLEGQGFRVLAAPDSASADRVRERNHVDLMVLDLGLPVESGLDYCRRLRGAGELLPIVMLTARGDDVDRIVGLELGADDYLPKPGNPRELVARIRAVLRRRGGMPAATPRPEKASQRFGACELDFASRVLRRGHGEQLLTSGEFALLSVLLKHAGQPLSRDRLLSLTQGRDAEPFERSIDVTVSRLRRLIEADPKKPRHLQTVWGVGYVFVIDA